MSGLIAVVRLICVIFLLSNVCSALLSNGENVCRSATSEKYTLRSPSGGVYTVLTRYRLTYTYHCCVGWKTTDDLHCDQKTGYLESVNGNSNDVPVLSISLGVSIPAFLIFVCICFVCYKFCC